MKYIQENLNKFYFTGTERVSGYTGDVLTFHLNLFHKQSNTNIQIVEQDFSPSPNRYNMIPFYVNVSGNTYQTINIEYQGQWDYNIYYLDTLVEVGRVYFDIPNRVINYTNNITINKKIIN
jgi:hypothetical protein